MKQSDEVSVIAEARPLVDTCPWFKDLPESALAEISSHARLSDLPAKSYLFRTGDKTSDVYCIVEGRLRLGLISAVGQEFTITEFSTGVWLGEQVLASDQRRIIDAQAIGNVRILMIPGSVLSAIAIAHPNIYQNLFVDTIQRSRELCELMAGMLFYPLRARLAGRLLQLANEYGETSAEGVFVTARLSQQDFARLSLGSRQRINKILREWCEQEVLIMADNRYLIKDLSALQQELEPA